jgi:hypothetical protein
VTPRRLGIQRDLFVASEREREALEGIRAPYVRNSDTSAAAALSVEDRIRGDARKILDALRRNEEDGLTVDEVEGEFGMLHQTAGARMRGLVLAGLVRDSGRRRLTRNGRPAVVWVAGGGAIE